MAHLHIFYNTRAHLKITIRITWYGSVIKNIPANAGVAVDMGSIPGLERFQPEGGNGNPLQYSCQDNPMDRGAWQATVCAGPEHRQAPPGSAPVKSQFLRLLSWSLRNSVWSHFSSLGGKNVQKMYKVLWLNPSFSSDGASWTRKQNETQEIELKIHINTHPVNCPCLLRPKAKHKGKIFPT